MVVLQVTRPHGRRRLQRCARLFGLACCVVAGALFAAGAMPVARATVSTTALGFTLRLDQGQAPKIAGRRIGTFRQAVRAFSRPAAVAPKAGAVASCRASWPKLGLAIEFSAPSARCEVASLGSWLTVTASTRRWYSSAGLRVGDAAGRLHDLYPQARRLDFLGYGPAWELETGGPYCDGGPPLALAAIVRANRVTSLIVTHVPACG
jgi:hypothetical protein